MSDLRKAAQQALEALDSDHPDIQLRAAITLRAALAQPEQTRSQQMRDAGYTRRPRQLQKEDEPVAYQWLGTSVTRKRVPKTAEADAWQPLYTAPPQRKPLTDEEIQDLAKSMDESVKWPLCRAIEKAHGIR